MFDRRVDMRVRNAAFDWLSEQVERFGDVLPRRILAQGFRRDAVRVPKLGPQGIFKPAILAEGRLHMGDSMPVFACGCGSEDRRGTVRGMDLP